MEIKLKVKDLPLNFKFVSCQTEVKGIKDALGIIDEADDYDSLFISQDVESGDVKAVWGCGGTVPYSSKSVVLLYPLGGDISDD